MLPALLDTLLPKAPYRKAVFRLQRLMEQSDAPKVMPEVEHTFSPGLYERAVTMPKDMLGVGRVHRKEHKLVIESGLLTIVDERDVYTVRGPCTISCEANTKRTLYAHTEVRLRTKHQVSAQTFDIQAIEDELVSDDYEDTMKKD